MVRVPRYGTHDGIKYSPRRTLVYPCDRCGKYSIKTGRTDKFCEVCSINAKRESNRRAEKNRPERNEYKNELRARLRGEGRIKQNLNGTSTQVCGTPPTPIVNSNAYSTGTYLPISAWYAMTTGTAANSNVVA